MDRRTTSRVGALVVLDGRHDLVNGIPVSADGVAVEDLTVHSYRQNGVLSNGAGDDVYVVDSIFRHNRLRMAPNSQRPDETATYDNCFVGNDFDSIAVPEAP